MPSLKNISERKFVIGGKELNKGESLPFAQSVIDAHIASYPNELVQVEGEESAKEITVDIKVDAKEVIEQAESLANDPETTEEEAQEFVDSVNVEVSEGETKTELVAKVTADAPKRGRKPKAKE